MCSTGGETGPRVGPTLCPIVWLPYAPESVEKSLQESRVVFVQRSGSKSKIEVKVIDQGERSRSNLWRAAVNIRGSALSACL